MNYLENPDWKFILLPCPFKNIYRRYITEIENILNNNYSKNTYLRDVFCCSLQIQPPEI